MDTAMSKMVPFVPIKADESGQPLPIGEEVPVQSGPKLAMVQLKRISELFAGNRQPPDFGDGVPSAYALFFAAIEKPVIDFMTFSRKPETDANLEELYRHLRRRPDGTHANPAFGYMQAGARLYMSLRDVSRAEFEAVAQRLALSAKHFSRGYSSTNYFRVVGAQFRGEL